MRESILRNGCLYLFDFVGMIAWSIQNMIKNKSVLVPNGADYLRFMIRQLTLLKVTKISG